MTHCPTCHKSLPPGLTGNLFVGENGEQVKLSMYETEMLKYILEHGEVTTAALDWHIFKSLAVDAPNVRKVTMHRLQKKINPLGFFIHTHLGDRAHGGASYYWIDR
jgi:hypothetical protein